jgi:acetylornithine deacetylase/succinyl-diaminopimelate desuccinylase-like protein
VKSSPRSDVVSLLTDLVACPSTNPHGLPPSANYPGEAPLLRLLEDFFRPRGARVIQEEVLPGRCNLLAFFDGLDRSRTILLTAHADNVPQDGMTIPPFTPDIRDGKLFGRGSADPKGGMAAMLAALDRFLAAGRPFPCGVCFAATCNEESGADGAQALMRLHPKEFTAAIVAEPTDLQIVHLHKGALRFTVEARGVAVHSSLPERGVSAIRALCDVVARIEGPYRAALLRRIHPLAGSPRVSVGVIHGGSQVNVVPDRAEIQVDRRTLPGETTDSVQREFEEILQAVQRESDPRLAFSCRLTENYPPLDESPDSWVGRLIAEASRQVLGKATFAVAPFGTDGGVFSSQGLPSLIIGPGSISQAHTKDEYVELAQVRQAVDLYETILALSATA